MILRTAQSTLKGFGYRRVFKTLAVSALLGAVLGVSPGSVAPTIAERDTLSGDRAPAGLAEELRISAAELEREIAARLTRVPEFKFIRAEAEKLGVQVYLFGGTAAGYAHYVKWDLLREKGDTNFQADRFDYDFTNIFRSTQDLDIVVDGPADKAETLRKALITKFPSFQGNKDQWEVRLLRQDLDDKQALLNNPDFLNQHTDSNSTGLIDVTSKVNEPAVRDLRDWNSRNPYFLRDVAEGKIHYYFSPLHDTTSRARQGLNPPIFSVIRFLTKAFQYDLEIRTEDLTKIRAVIAEFDPKAPRSDAYVQRWLEKNGPKLVRHAVDIEAAWNKLEELGLRQKLIAISDPKKIDSMGWWLSKEPLRTSPVGQGARPTAKDLGIAVVAHETSSFLAYESITRAHTGAPNVFVSRQSAAGETAIYGNGFYTALGRKGMRGTGLTIRFEVDPRAREGTDFFRPVNNAGMVVFTNKKALRVIQEDLRLGLLEYLEAATRIDPSDRGILEKFRRRLNNRSRLFTPEEVAAARQFIRGHRVDGWRDAALGEWLKLEVGANDLDLALELMRADYKVTQIISEFIATHDDRKMVPLIEFVLGSGSAEANMRLVGEVLSRPYWKRQKEHYRWVRQLLAENHPLVAAPALFLEIAKPGRDNQEIARLIETNEVNIMALLEGLSTARWQSTPLLKQALEKAFRSQSDRFPFERWVRSQKAPVIIETIKKVLEDKILNATKLNLREVQEDLFTYEFYSKKVRTPHRLLELQRFVLDRFARLESREQMKVLFESGLGAQMIVSLLETTKAPRARVIDALRAQAALERVPLEWVKTVDSWKDEGDRLVETRLRADSLINSHCTFETFVALRRQWNENSTGRLYGELAQLKIARVYFEALKAAPPTDDAYTLHRRASVALELTKSALMSDAKARAQLKPILEAAQARPDFEAAIKQIDAMKAPKHAHAPARSCQVLWNAS